jgi:ABC-type phosphate transport system substrate-binding protein
MNRFKWLLLAAVAALLAGAGLSAQAALAIIAHPSNPLAGISADDAERIYLSKTSEFPNGRRAAPVDQSAGSAARARFCKSVLKRTEDELQVYWSKVMFSGKGQPPREVGDDAAVRAWVAGNPDAIGYIDGKFVDGSVKVLLIVP